MVLVLFLAAVLARVPSTGASAPPESGSVGLRRGALVAANATVGLDSVRNIDDALAAGPGSRIEQERNVPDVNRDVTEPRGDLVQAYASYPADGQALLDVQVVQYDSPLGVNWQLGDTGLEWEVVVAAHRETPFYVELFGADGQLYSGVLDHDGNLICDDEVGIFPESRSYAIRFDVHCLGNAQNVESRPTLYYEDVSTHTKTKDTMSTPIVLRNDAYVPVPACVPTAVVAPRQPTSTEFVAIAPARLLETRPTSDTIDCEADRIGIRGARSETALHVIGRAGVPADAAAVALNVTVTEAQDSGFIEVYPCGTGRPDGSNVNYVEGSTVATAVIAKVGATGDVCLYTYGRVQLVVDLGGWFPASSDYQSLSPQRILDTRNLGTIQNPDSALRSAGQVTELQIAGTSGIPAAASAAAINITAVDTRQPGYVTAFPCDRGRPNASNLNYDIGQNVAGLAVVPLDPDGRVCLFTYGATHLVVDINGWFPTGTAYHAQPPARLLDTRAGPDIGTVDGQFSGIGTIAAGETLQLRVAGRAGLSAAVTAVVLVITSTESTGPGFITAFPCGAQRPTASNVNHSTGATVANTAVVRLSDDGTVCLFAYATTHLIVDVAGSFTD